MQRGRRLSLAKPVITHVLDTSAILAHYLHEPGADIVQALLARGRGMTGISLVSLVELRARLPEATSHAEEAERAYRLYTETLTTILPFTRETAETAIRLRAATRPRLPLVDALIAASAKEQGAILVHRDPHMSAMDPALVAQLVLVPKA